MDNEIYEGCGISGLCDGACREKHYKTCTLHFRFKKSHDRKGLVKIRIDERKPEVDDDRKR